MKIGDRMPDHPTNADLDRFVRLGIEYATIWTGEQGVSDAYLSALRECLTARGIRIWNVGILDLHCDAAMVLGLPDRDRKIALYKNYLRALGRAGISYTTYAHMANIKMLPYYQTSVTQTCRGAITRAFDSNVASSLPLSHGRPYSEEEIWDTFVSFIREIMPVAEEAGVRIGLHPDDPPLPSLGGVARIFRNYAAYERAFEAASSPNLGACLCVGTWAEGGEAMGCDVYEAVRRFGKAGRLFKVHFRNVDAPLPQFRETLPDEGYISMPKIVRALHKTGFDGVLIPDHVPQDGGTGLHTAYTIGYMRALREAMA